jgi:hypothetical protein
MYKRPHIRPRETPKTFHKSNIDPTTILYDIVNPKPTEFHQPIKSSIFKQDDYITLYNRYQRAAGLPEKSFDYLQPETPYIGRVVEKNPTIEGLDWICVSINVLKNGKVKVKLNTTMCELYEKYYKKNKIPPNKSLIKAYKTFGFSDEFIEKLDKKLSARPKLSNIIGLKIDKVFNKPTIPKTKKKKPDPEPEPDIDEVIDDENDDDENDEDDDPGEDGELDIDIEPDDAEDQAVEEYFSDGE